MHNFNIYFIYYMINIYIHIYMHMTIITMAALQIAPMGQDRQYSP